MSSPHTLKIAAFVTVAVAIFAATGRTSGQTPPYDVRPDVAPPYWRIRYEAAKEPGSLIFPVTYTAWIPPGVKPLRGVIVHQHGCGEGSCTSGLSGAWDLHWQALARRHDCALVAPAYEQPEGADCQMWCDPRNGSAAAFKRALADLGKASGHSELATVPWALWGHSGGGHWAGGLTMLEPERVVAAWLRSGVPLFEANPDRAGIKPHVLPDAALAVPLVCNPGTKEGVTATDNKFKGVWPANQAFFKAVRSRGGLVGVAIDPLTTHECGNSRYLAIPWLDACLAARLPAKPGEPLTAMNGDEAWLAPIAGGEAVAARGFGGDPLTLGWLPNQRIATAWTQYVEDTAVADTTPPPAPTALRLAGTALTWEAEADLDSGLAGFVIERNGERIATLPEKQRNPFGRPLFQGLLYSDTPPQPLAAMSFTPPDAAAATYRVFAINTVGLESPAAVLSPATAGATESTAPATDVLAVPWGQIDTTGEAVDRARLVVERRPADGRLALPKMFPQVIRATLAGPEPQDIPIEIATSGEEVHLILPPPPATAAEPAIVAVELADKTEQFADGRIVLTALDARVEGKQAKLESHPGNHRIGFWANPADAVAWTWKATRWGRYEARLTFSNASPEGTEIEVTIGAEKLTAKLPSTGSWYRYATLPLGRVYLPKSGDVPVTVRCTKLMGGAVMNLKALTLEPACEGTPPQQAADRTVLLHGRDATVRGTMLRYEPAEAKQTLGFWTRPTDAATWAFHVTQPGEFEVEVLQGCGNGQGGSDMGVVFDTDAEAPHKLAFVVEDTGGFQQFRPRVIGRVTLGAGDHTLRIAPDRIAKGAACDIRQVRLLPVTP